MVRVPEGLVFEVMAFLTGGGDRVLNDHFPLGLSLGSHIDLFLDRFSHLLGLSFILTNFILENKQISW